MLEQFKHSKNSKAIPIPINHLHFVMNNYKKIIDINSSIHHDARLTDNLTTTIGNKQHTNSDKQENIPIQYLNS